MRIKGISVKLLLCAGHLTLPQITKVILDSFRKKICGNFMVFYCLKHGSGSSAKCSLSLIKIIFFVYLSVIKFSHPFILRYQLSHCFHIMSSGTKSIIFKITILGSYNK